MAFSTAEQNKIVQILGYGGKILQAGSVIYNKILSDRLTDVPVDEETLVRSYLAQVAAIESQMNQAINRLTAEKVGDITTNKDELTQLRNERKKIAKEIAEHVDIPYQGVSGNGSIVC